MPLLIDFITEEDLRAYARGALEASHASAVAVYVASDPDAWERVNAHRQQPGRRTSSRLGPGQPDRIFFEGTDGT